MRIRKAHLIASALVGVPLVIGFARKLVEVGALDFYDELILLMLAPFALKGLGIATSIPRIVPFFLAFFAYLLVSLLGALFNQVPPKAIILQGLLELKLPLFVAAFAGMPNAESVILRVIGLLKVALALSVPLIAFRYASPAGYDALFVAGAHHEQFDLFTGVTLPRAAGMFVHPGNLATGSATIGIFSFFMMVNGEKAKRHALWFVLALTLLLLTFQRAEAATFFLSITVVAFLSGAIRLSVFLFIAAAFVFWLPSEVLYSYASEYLSRIGLFDVAESQNARVVLYVHAFELAENHLPLGAGLGAYGGFASVLFQSEVYDLLGFGRYWWYGNKSFLLDVFWAHVIGEAGWLGAVLYASALGWYLNWLFCQRWLFSGRDRVIWQIALASAILLFVTSLLSPNLTSVLPLVFGLMFSAPIWHKLRASRRVVDAQRS